jgi:hypothetical protein
LRQSSKRFARLGNGFSKRLEPHCAAVSLYVAYYNLTRVHESLKCTPAMALGVADRAWTIGDLIDARTGNSVDCAGPECAGSPETLHGN